MSDQFIVFKLFLAAAQSFFASGGGNELKAITKWFEEDYDPEIRTFVLFLAEHGWYITDAMSCKEIMDLNKRVKQDSGSVDQILVDYYENNFVAIANYFQEKNPSRAPIINQAVEAHKAGMYYLSVLGFLAQADGFCFDEGVKLFYDKNKKGHIAEVAKLIRDKLLSNDPSETDPLLTPIAIENGLISYNKNERDKDWEHLNRHTAMHGESVTYGTYLNSLKAFSCMAFYAGYLLHYKEEVKEQLAK